MSQMPQVPTAAEPGMTGLVLGIWFGMMAPRGTASAILAHDSAAVNEVPAAQAWSQK